MLGTTAGRDTDRFATWYGAERTRYRAYARMQRDLNARKKPKASFRILVVQIQIKELTLVLPRGPSSATCVPTAIFPEPSPRPRLFLFPLCTQIDTCPPCDRSKVATSISSAQQAAAQDLSKTSLASPNHRGVRTSPQDTHSVPGHQPLWIHRARSTKDCSRCHCRGHRHRSVCCLAYQG